MNTATTFNYKTRNEQAPVSTRGALRTTGRAVPLNKSAKLVFTSRVLEQTPPPQKKEIKRELISNKRSHCVHVDPVSARELWSWDTFDSHWQSAAAAQDARGPPAAGKWPDGEKLCVSASSAPHDLLPRTGPTHLVTRQPAHCRHGNVVSSKGQARVTVNAAEAQGLHVRVGLWACPPPTTPPPFKQLGH